MKKFVILFVTSLLSHLIFIGLLFVMLFLPPKVEAQFPLPDSCLKLLDDPYEELHFQNPDSVKVDSCEYSTTFKQVYAKKNY
ncbi:MAG: hypothetical protein HZB41_14390 [Ignavibacteriae bacterium]|nr:hypothetical protein [Ignavibacteriota bacterium]